MDVFDGGLVTFEIRNAHPKADWSLVPGDLLTKRSDGTWAKECPGIMIVGFILTPEQEQNLKPVKFTCDGFYYTILS